MKTAKRIKIVIGRFGVEPQIVEAGEGITVSEALRQAGIEMNSGEKVWVNGDEATLQDVLENKDIVNVVGHREGGNC